MRRATRLGGHATRGHCEFFVASRLSFEVCTTHVFRHLGYVRPNYSQTNLALVHLFCDISVFNQQKAKNMENQQILISEILGAVTFDFCDFLLL